MDLKSLDQLVKQIPSIKSFYPLLALSVVSIVILQIGSEQAFSISVIFVVLVAFFALANEYVRSRKVGSSAGRILERSRQRGAGGIVVAASMSSIPPDKYKQWIESLRSIISSIKHGMGKDVYFGGQNISSQNDFDRSNLALNECLGRIATCEVFVLIINDSRQSSTLLEMGFALAAGKIIIVYFREGVQVPYLVHGAAGAIKFSVFAHEYRADGEFDLSKLATHIVGDIRDAYEYLNKRH